MKHIIEHIRLMFNKELRNLFKNSSWLLSSEFISVLVNVVIGFLVPKYLGVSNYGMIALVFLM